MSNISYLQAREPCRGEVRGVFCQRLVIGLGAAIQPIDRVFQSRELDVRHAVQRGGESAGFGGIRRGARRPRPTADDPAGRQLRFLKSDVDE